MDLFESPTSLLEEARDDLTKVLSLIDDYFDELELLETREIDKISGNVIIKRIFTKKIPKEIERIASTVIKELRNCLDQSVYAAVNSLPGQNNPKISFPIASGPTDLEGKLKKEFPKELWPTLQSFQPYRTSKDHVGGNDLLCKLNDAANINKHRFRFKVGGKIKNFKVGHVIGTNAVRLPIPPDWDWQSDELFIAELKPDACFSYDFELEPMLAFGYAEKFTGIGVERLLVNFFDLASYITIALKDTIKCSVN